VRIVNGAYHRYNRIVDYKAAIRRNLKRYCALRKMNYSALSREAGIPLRTIQSILYDERRREPRISTLDAIAKALKVPVDRLIH
jgi:transcriptional regulator with XRE-family HTH domain